MADVNIIWRYDATNDEWLNEGATRAVAYTTHDQWTRMATVRWSTWAWRRHGKVVEAQGSAPDIASAKQAAAAEAFARDGLHWAEPHA